MVRYGRILFQYELEVIIEFFIDLCFGNFGKKKVEYEVDGKMDGIIVGSGVNGSGLVMLLYLGYNKVIGFLFGDMFLGVILNEDEKLIDVYDGIDVVRVGEDEKEDMIFSYVLVFLR